MINPKILLRQTFFKHRALLVQFIKFGMVGSSGLLIDTLTVYMLRPYIGLTFATIAGYFIAASSNWIVNRLWTFHTVKADHSLLSQWLRFIATNSMGFCLNRGTVFLLFFLSNTCRQHIYIALIAGAIMGMLANFNLSRKLVYTDLFSKND
ncbi:GtrA family protein [Commensalibacter oyaizuii]|uniref:GtrA family protein n=1 Tax=Commensalibacter oyaizuii TaxID=3043873 RepID=A0ABT6Q0D5_9PROT|nr:GtrA family protein [Commensalibacter sp. TBRC 16381]MDI2090577.1 GtrA family protein [Commensalibacter sp. TBRC 16381]